MNRLLVTLAMFVVVVAMTFAACTWGWVPQHWNSCTGPTWDCNIGGCGAGDIVSVNFKFAEYGNPVNCCECKQTTKLCSGSGCSGYVYYRDRREVGNRSCSPVEPSNPNSEYYCGPQVCGGGGSG